MLPGTKWVSLQMQFSSLPPSPADSQHILSHSPTEFYHALCTKNELEEVDMELCQMKREFKEGGRRDLTCPLAALMKSALTTVNHVSTGILSR